MKQSVASAGHVTVTVAGPAITTLLITSNGIAVDEVPESRMAAVRTFAVPVSVVTVTTPRLVPPSCVKLRITRKRLSPTAIVREPPGVIVALWKDPAKAKTADAQKTTAIRDRAAMVFTWPRLLLFSPGSNRHLRHALTDVCRLCSMAVKADHLVQSACFGAGRNVRRSCGIPAHTSATGRRRRDRPGRARRPILFQMQRGSLPRRRREKLHEYA